MADDAIRSLFVDLYYDDVVKYLPNHVTLRTPRQTTLAERTAVAVAVHEKKSKGIQDRRLDFILKEYTQKAAEMGISEEELQLTLNKEIEKYFPNEGPK
ncbi:hypothetical protein JXB27_03615 [Candidatus Woesearchaeota archaeon]|nr:hypothetical protein [Candidatus Woesearchaeota archaeon]